MVRFDTFSPFPHLDLAWTATISFITPIDLPSQQSYRAQHLWLSFLSAAKALQAFRTLKQCKSALISQLWGHGLGLDILANLGIKDS